MEKREEAAARRQYQKAVRRGYRPPSPEETAKREAEHARRQRVKDGLEAPKWDDIENGQHLIWLDRLAALEIRDNDRDRALIETIRRGARDGCLGVFGNSARRVNALLAEAFLAEKEQP
jgi:hypothetical protein